MNEYNWGVVNPDKVACIYADNPALSDEDFAKLPALAKHDVPLLHICGSEDFLVQRYTRVVEDTYHQLGGRITVIIKEGHAHHRHSLQNAKPIADWIEQHMKPSTANRPAFVDRAFTKGYYYSLEPSFIYLKEENSYATARGPGFTECYDRYDGPTSGKFKMGGMSIVVPKTVAPGKPWVFTGDALERDATVEQALLAKGYHILIVSPMGSGFTQKQWNDAYKLLVDNGFSNKPVLKGIGPKAGEAYAWAIANPDKVSCIYARNPLMKSLMAGKQQPIDNLAALAKAGVPVLHDSGALDPWLDSQTRVVEKRYQELGGKITVIVRAGEGHFSLSPKDPKSVVDFIIKNAPIPVKGDAPISLYGGRARQGGSPLDQLVLQDDTTPPERQELPNEAVAVIRGEGKGAAYQVAAFSSDDTRLALGTSGGAVELWGLDGGKPKRLAVLRPAAKAGPVLKLALSRDGRWLASIHGIVAGFLALWRLDKDGGSLVDTLKTPPRMDEVTFHPGGKVLVCSSPRNGQDLPIVAKCYAVSDKGLEPLKGEFEGAVGRFTFMPDRRFAAIYFTPERNGPLYGSEVMFWTFSDQTQDVAVHQRIRLETGIRSIAFTRDGKWLATGSLDNKVRLWDLTNNPPSVAKLFDVPIWARDLAFTAKDSHLVVFSGGMNILLWNVAAGRIEHQWDLKNNPKAKLGAGAISASAIASDGRHILYSRFGGAAVILRLPIR